MEQHQTLALKPALLLMKLTKKEFIKIVFFTAVMLLLLRISMHYISDMNWSSTDFAIVGALLFGIGVLIQLLRKKVKKTTFGIILFLIVLLLLVWVELGVGIFGTPLAGN